MNDDVVVVKSDQIDELIQNQQETNDLITQLVQYNLEKQAAEKQAAEKQAAQEKKDQEEQEQLQKEEEQQKKEEQQKEEQQIKSEQTTEQREVTTAETIQHIDEQVTLINQLFVGQLVFIGVLLGVVLMKIFWDRFHI